MPTSLARWFIEGDVDWDYINEQLGQWGPVIAGALFGAGASTASRRAAVAGGSAASRLRRHVLLVPLGMQAGGAGRTRSCTSMQSWGSLLPSATIGQA